MVSIVENTHQAAFPKTEVSPLHAARVGLAENEGAYKNTGGCGALYAQNHYAMSACLESPR